MSGARPPMLDDFGLLQPLRWQLSNSSTAPALPSDLRVELTPDCSKQRRDGSIPHFCQEALTNAARHFQRQRSVASLCPPLDQVSSHLTCQKTTVALASIPQRANKRRQRWSLGTVQRCRPAPDLAGACRHRWYQRPDRVRVSCQVPLGCKACNNQSQGENRLGIHGVPGQFKATKISGLDQAVSPADIMDGCSTPECFKRGTEFIPATTEPFNCGWQERRLRLVSDQHFTDDRRSWLRHLLEAGYRCGGRCRTGRRRTR